MPDRFVNWEGRPAVRRGGTAFAVLDKWVGDRSVPENRWTEVNASEVSESGRPVDKGTWLSMFREAMYATGGPDRIPWSPSARPLDDAGSGP